MTSADAAVDRLRRLAEQAPALGPDGEWLASALEQYLRHAHEGVTLDRALGVASTRHRWPWWRAEQRERERSAARQLVESCGAPDRALTFLNRYAAGRGRLERTSADFSDPRAQAACSYLAETGGRVPTNVRTLERAAGRDS